MIDHSFTKTGLLIFTLEDGNEYVASIANYIGDTSKNAVFRVQKMNGSLTLCSYSLGRYATAENYSNTAYIQYADNICKAGCTAIHLYKFRGRSQSYCNLRNLYSAKDKFLDNIFLQSFCSGDNACYQIILTAFCNHFRIALVLLCRSLFSLYRYLI